MTPPYPKASRILALFDFRAGISGAAALERLRSHLRARFGADATIQLGARHPQDGFPIMAGARGTPEPVEAVIQITLPESGRQADLAAMAQGWGEDLAAVADLSRTTVSVGDAYTVSPVKGRIAVIFAGRRDPAVTVDAMRHWWLFGHAALPKEPRPYGYDQFHIDEEPSRLAADAAGVAHVSYDMSDTILAPTRDSLVGVVSEPERARKTIEDEIGFLDHSSWRGSMFELLEDAS